jgi:hypothetical protein
LELALGGHGSAVPLRTEIIFKNEYENSGSADWFLQQYNSVDYNYIVI